MHQRRNERGKIIGSPAAGLCYVSVRHPAEPAYCGDDEGENFVLEDGRFLDGQNGKDPHRTNLADEVKNFEKYCGMAQRGCQRQTIGAPQVKSEDWRRFQYSVPKRHDRSK
jgi:hypothetical protein